MTGATTQGGTLQLVATATGSRPRKRGTAAPSFCECGDHAFATVTKGFVALVSPEDAEQFRYYWNAIIAYRGYVIVSRSKSLGHQTHKTVVLAREILGLPSSVIADHANRNSLDNRRSNLRPCTRSQNASNKKVPSNNTSGFKGVCRYRNGTYRAVIKANGTRHELGVFKTLDEAKLAYAVGAFWFHREFARIT